MKTEQEIHSASLPAAQSTANYRGINTSPRSVERFQDQDVRPEVDDQQVHGDLQLKPWEGEGDGDPGGDPGVAQEEVGPALL